MVESRNQWRVMVATAVMALLVATGVAQTNPGRIGGGLNFFSMEQEIAMGRQYAEQLNRDLDLISDPYITGWWTRSVSGW